MKEKFTEDLPSEIKATKTVPNTGIARGRHPVLYIIAVIVVIGVGGGLWGVFSSEMPWMFFPGIAVLIVFMPATTSSFLHFRLPEKEKEYREIMALLSKENMGSPYADYVLKMEYRGADYVLPISFVCVFSFMGFFVLFDKNAQFLLQGMHIADDRPDIAQQVGSLVAIGMAFLGAYLWSMSFIFRRLITIDLPPGAYYSVGSRLVYATFLALAYFHLVSVIGHEKLVAMTPVVAFLAGIFPQRLLEWMLDYLRVIFKKPKGAADELPLDTIEGMNLFHKARLSELGIDNVQNLVQASLVELILKTPYRPRQLIDWIAQGRLVLEAKKNVTSLRRSGIRTIFALIQICKDEEALKVLASQSGLDEDYLRTICRVNRDKESIRRLEAAYKVLHVV